jgi:hypothetical protein
MFAQKARFEYNMHLSVTHSLLQIKTMLQEFPPLDGETKRINVQLVKYAWINYEDKL